MTDIEEITQEVISPIEEEIAKTRSLNVQLEVEKIKLEKNLKEIREMNTRKAMGGEISAGSVQKSENEKTKESHMERWKGAAFNPFKGAGAKALADLV